MDTAALYTKWTAGTELFTAALYTKLKAGYEIFMTALHIVYN